MSSVHGEGSERESSDVAPPVAFATSEREGSEEACPARFDRALVDMPVYGYVDKDDNKPYLIDAQFIKVKVAPEGHPGAGLSVPDRQLG